MTGVSETIWMAVIGAVMLAVLFILVRPGSPATKAISAVADGLAALVAVSTNNYNGGNNG